MHGSKLSAWRTFTRTAGGPGGPLPVSMRRSSGRGAVAGCAAGGAAVGQQIECSSCRVCGQAEMQSLRLWAAAARFPAAPSGVCIFPCGSSRCQQLDRCGRLLATLVHQPRLQMAWRAQAAAGFWLRVERGAENVGCVHGDEKRSHSGDLSRGVGCLLCQLVHPLHGLSQAFSVRPRLPQQEQ